MSLGITPAEIVAKAEASGAAGLLARAAHWERVELGQVAAVVNGAAFPSTGFNPDGRGMPLIRIRDVGAESSGTWFDGAWEHKHLVRNGDILIGMDGDFRVARWRGGDALLNQRVCRIDVDETRYLSGFLVLALQGYLDAIWAETSSITVKHLSSRSVAAIPLPAPPLDEQRRIAEILEDHLSRLDSASRAIEDSLLRLKALRDSSLLSAVGKAKRAAETVTYSLGKLAKVGSGMTPLRGNRAYYDGGTIPWITSGDLHQGVITRPSQFVTQKALDETSLKVVPAGSLLVAMYGEGKTRGTAAELGLDATTNQACAAITLHEPDLRAWVRLILDANYTGLRRLAAGGVQPNLNLSLIKAIEVPVPPADTRRMLISGITRIDEARERMKEELLSAQRRGTSLRRSLLAAAFSGRLTGNGSDRSRAEEMINA